MPIVVQLLATSYMNFQQSHHVIEASMAMKPYQSCWISFLKSPTGVLLASDTWKELLPSESALARFVSSLKQRLLLMTYGCSSMLSVIAVNPTHSINLAVRCLIVLPRS